MTTLVDFSDEPQYTIKAVCAQTGILPVTLRAWERRHEVLTPHRSENRYRLYSERDVAVLRWIKNRVDNGISISSAVSELRSQMRSGMVPEAVPTGPAASAAQRGAGLGPASQVLNLATPAFTPSQYARSFYKALIAHDDGRAGELFHEVTAFFDLATIFTEIITPALTEIGEAWYRGAIRVATEHFASAFVRGRLMTLLQAYPSRRNAPFLLIGGAPTEQHEISALMVAVLLRSTGLRVEYLGPDLPIQDLVEYAGQEHPDMIILVASLEQAALEMARMQEKLSKLRPQPAFGYGGAAFVRKPELRKRVPGVYLGNSMIEGIATVNSLLPKERARK